MLLAEELALVAIKPDKGRAQLGTGGNLNACLAGLLVAELLLDGAVATADDDRVVAVPGRAPTEPVLAAAAQVVAEKGSKLKAVLSHMSRGLEQRLGLPTQDAVLSGLATAGVLGPSSGGLIPKRALLNPAERDAVVGRLRAAASGDGPIEARTAVVLSMTGPAQLLEVVAPDRSTRKHARQRIDHALDGSDLASIGKVVRRLVEEAAAVAAGAG